MQTEGLMDVAGQTPVNKDNQKEEEEEEDYLDEYGNLKEDAVEVKKVENEKERKGKSKEDTKKAKEVAKPRREKDDKKPSKKLLSEGWKDLDSLPTESEESRRFVKSRVMMPDNKLMFPRNSSLNWYEQETFLYKQSQARSGQLSPACGPQWTAYQNFASLVSEEQEEFNKFTRDNFHPTPICVCEEHRRYVTEHRAARLARPLSLPRWWTKLRDVRLASASEEQLCSLTVEQTLLELGSRPKANIPCLIRNFHGKKTCHSLSLPSQYLRMIHKVPPDPSIKPGTIGLTRGQDRRQRQLGESQAVETEEKVDTSKFLYKESCIDDPNCSLLAQLVVPNIIVSAAAIKCLMDNHRPHFNKTWEIPFVVRTFQSEVDTRTVVILGKPLLSREVTDEDFCVLAHKVAIQVGLFQRDWEAQIAKKAKQQKPIARESPVENLFGETDVSMEDLEVFGGNLNTKPLSGLFKEEAAGKDVISQLDGGDTDSDDDQLVISDSPRRSTRERKRVSESEPARGSRGRGRGRGRAKGASTQVVRRSRRRNDKDKASVPGMDISLEEDLLDFEPEENSNPKDESSSSDDDNSANPEDVKMMLHQKLSLAKHLSPATAAMIKSLDVSSNSSEEEEDDDPAALMKKKLRAVKQNDMKPVGELKSSSSEESSDSEDMEAQDLLQRKMAAIMKDSNNSQTKEIEKDKTEMAKEETDNDSSQLMEVEEKEVLEESDDEVTKYSSPNKKVKRVVSSDSEEEMEVKELVKAAETEQDPIAKKLAELGREKVNVKKLQKKMSLEKKLKIMSDLKQKKTSLQNADRDQRVSQRNKGYSSKDEHQSDQEEAKEISPKNTPGKSPPSSSDSEGEEGRFDKFSSSNTGNEASEKNLLDNLLTGQNKLLTLDGRRKVEERPQQSSAVFQSMFSVAPGLPPVDQFKPPLPGTNVSYRLWRLYDKVAPAGREKGLRVLVRSKVAGVTKEDRLVTPSVKVEHQSHFGAEQVTASQVTREWVATLLRPASTLCRVRVLPDSKIAMIEEKSLPDLTTESRKLQSDPGRQLVNLFNAFSELTKLKAGQYILKHSSKTGAFCEVYEAAEEANDKPGAGGLLDLHKMYSTLQPGHTVPGKLPYCPIDTGVVTPWHLVNGRVPGTFEPEGERPSSNKRGRGGGRGGARGGRGGKGRGRGKKK